jgi:hypothetical protein
MKRIYFLTLITFFNFFPVGYSQNTILAIVGEKISVSPKRSPTPLQMDTFIIDGKERIDTVLLLKLFDPVDIAVYKVSKLIIGDFKEDTISFVFHNRNHIASSNNVLLLLDKPNTLKHYILKKQPVEVYKTDDNRWASPYIAEISKHSQIKPQKIRFDPELVFDVSIYDDEYIKKHYPAPYYKIKKNKVFAVQGIYAEELAALACPNKLSENGNQGLGQKMKICPEFNSATESGTEVELFNNAKPWRDDLSESDTPKGLLPP